MPEESERKMAQGARYHVADVLRSGEERGLNV